MLVGNVYKAQPSVETAQSGETENKSVSPPPTKCRRSVRLDLGERDPSMSRLYRTWDAVVSQMNFDSVMRFGYR